MLNYLTFLVALAGIYALSALSLVLVWGRAGMVNLGIVGFYAVGAYTSALVVQRLQWPMPLGWLAAALVSAAVAACLAGVTRRLRGDYLAIVTLGFAEVVRSVALNETWLTRGADGISGIPGPFKSVLGDGFNMFYAVLTWTIVGLAAWGAMRLLNAPFGRVLRAIRDDSDVAEVAGKDVASYQVQIYAIGAALVGLAGALYAHFTSYIVPDVFSLMFTMYVFLAATAGGNTRVAGALLGSVGLLALLEGSRFLAGHLPGLSAQQVAALREAFVGVLLLGLLIFRPSGVLEERGEPDKAAAGREENGRSPAGDSATAADEPGIDEAAAQAVTR